jgi:hypothetical protein
MRLVVEEMRITDDIWPISETTFFEKRKKVIEQITKSLSINGTLDFVTIDYGLGRNSDGECRFLIKNIKGSSHFEATNNS